MGLDWSEPVVLNAQTAATAPSSPGVYKLMDLDSSLLYVGESDNMQYRLRSHIAGPWNGRTVSVSYCEMPHLRLHCQRLEMETDVIAGYYAATKHAPEFQVGGRSVGPDVE